MRRGEFDQRRFGRKIASTGREHVDCRMVEDRLVQIRARA